MGDSNSTAIIINILGPNDHAQIADLYVASRADALPYLNRVRSDEEVRLWIQNTALQRGITWVARCGDQVVGFLNLVGENITQFYLLPGFYRRGIGSQLLARAKEKSPQRLWLYTFQKNARARVFYEKHGFRATCFADGMLNEEKEPDILYEWPAIDELGSNVESNPMS